MRSPTVLLLSAFAATMLATNVFAEPIDFSEVSLLVRARESEGTIVQQVQRRKLVRPLTPQQEGMLRSQGATESLIQALRASNLALAQADAAAYEARREQLAKAPRRDVRGSAAGESAAGGARPADDLHVFEVSAGHPVNLSQWGGPDYEFAFRGRARLDDGIEDAVMIDNARTFTHTATYLGEGRQDSTTVFDRRNYTSVMDHSFTRGLRIDRTNPVWMKGVPYTLYPVYAAGGVSLYYIGATSDSVKLAVQTAWR